MGVMSPLLTQGTCVYQEPKMAELQKVFGMGTKEAEKVSMDIQTKMYRNSVRKALSDGTLEAAESKAAVLTVRSFPRNAFI